MNGDPEVHDAEVVDEGTALAALTPGAPALLQRIERAPAQPAAMMVFDREKVNLLKATVMPKETTDAELDLFLHVCKRTGLDPFAKQIYAIRRKGKLTIQTAIDGFRLIAERTNRYAGQLGPYWCGADGQWSDIWLQKDYPFAARVGVLRVGFVEPVFAVARWMDFAPKDMSDAGATMWRNMGPHQLAKCAEAQALRRAFPQELSGMYTDEEMQQAQRAVAPPPSFSARVEAAQMRLRNAQTVAGVAALIERHAQLLEELRTSDDPSAGPLLRDLAAYQDERAAAVASAPQPGEQPIAERVAKARQFLANAKASTILKSRWALPQTVKLMAEVSPDLRRQLEHEYREMMDNLIEQEGKAMG